MNEPARPATPQDNERATADERSTGLPVFRSWPAVYLVVVASFAIWVVILALLPRVFA